MSVAAAVVLALVLTAALLVLVGPGWDWRPLIGAWELLRFGPRPHRGDNPVGSASTAPDLDAAWPVVSLVDAVARLEQDGSTVAAEFLPPGERVDRRPLPAAGGVLLVPDDVDVPVGWSEGGPVVIRTRRPEAVRVEHGGCREAARIRREAYRQLLRDRAARRGDGVPEPTVGPSGPSGVSSANRPLVRPSPGRRGRH